jgi:ABC-2 type transport system ATP-binding protein
MWRAFVAPSVGGMIEIEGLTKRYGNKVAVDGLNFTVDAGTVTGFLGPKWCGQVDDDADHRRA